MSASIYAAGEEFVPIMAARDEQTAPVAQARVAGALPGLGGRSGRLSLAAPWAAWRGLTVEFGGLGRRGTGVAVMILFLGLASIVLAAASHHSGAGRVHTGRIEALARRQPSAASRSGGIPAALSRAQLLQAERRLHATVRHGRQGANRSSIRRARRHATRGRRQQQRSSTGAGASNVRYVAAPAVTTQSPGAEPPAYVQPVGSSAASETAASPSRTASSSATGQTSSNHPYGYGGLLGAGSSPSG